MNNKKPAKLKSKKELAEKLLKGKIFYTEEGNVISYHETLNPPFRYVVKGDLPSLEPMWEIWKDYDSFYTDLNWWEKKVGSFKNWFKVGK